MRSFQKLASVLFVIWIMLFLFEGNVLAVSDLEGEWFLGGSDLQGAHTWDGHLIINSAGVVTGGEINSSEGPAYSIKSGNFSINSMGGVTGSFKDSDGITTQFTMQMDAQKGVVAGEGNAAGNEDGFFVFTKKSTGFAGGDLEGEWFLGGSDLQGAHTWDGHLIINSAGVVTGGEINSSEGPAYSIKSGNFSINSMGGVTGSFKDSDGITTQFTMQMDAQKGVVAGEGNAAGNEDGFFVFIRRAASDSSKGMPWLPLLLDN